MGEFILFGLVDNAVMLIGAFTGLSVERLLPARLRSGLGAVVGAGLGNAVSDFMGGIACSNASLAWGSLIGCLLALGLIPVLARLQKGGA